MKTAKSKEAKSSLDSNIAAEFTNKEWSNFNESGNFPGPKFVVGYEGGERVLKGGKIYHKNPMIVYGKQNQDNVNLKSLKHWDPKLAMIEKVKMGAITAIQAIVPLCIFLYLVLMILKLYQ